MASSTEAALESLRQLGSTDPPVWIAPKPELSEAVRAASKLLFACLKPHTPKSPFDQLLTDGFDAEQIWQQIDLQTQPLLSNLRREVKKFEKNPDEHFSLKDALGGGEKKATGSKEIKEDDFDDMDLDMEDEDGDDDEDEDEDDDDEGTREKGSSEEKSGSEAEGESDEEDMERDSEGEENCGVEDKFLKIKHLQKYLEEDEAREYGYESKNKKAKKDVKIDNEEEEDGEDEEDADEEDELGLFNAHDDEDEDADKLENARYSDFFVANKGNGSQKRSKLKDLSPDDEQETNKSLGNQRKDSLSTHEKELEKLQSKIKQMEQANLDAKVWTMQGEVTAAQRQKNSALEVHLDFEHNMRPAPVVTEEVTASIEDMIKNRIIEGRFDDVQKPPSLPSKAPREVKELDESKSKKGLAEVYEEEYVQKADPAFTPLSFSDEQKKEASMLFKKLCLKLDALSHFHFTPKPVIEDMSIQVNVPALAMEEIAPVAISDAAMLAPEEVFAGKGDITEEAELTKAERKRRRANKKRKFKAEAAKRMVKKAGDRVLLNQSNGKGE